MAIGTARALFHTAALTTNVQNVDLSGLDLAEGDFVLITVGQGSGLDRTVNIQSSGWEADLPKFLSNDTYKLGAETLFKVMGATPDTTFSFSFVTGSSTGTLFARIEARSGVDPENPFAAASVSAVALDENNPDPPAITPVTDGALIIAQGGIAPGNNAAAGANFTCANMIEIAQDYGAGGSSYEIAWASYEHLWSSGDGEFDPAPWTSNIGGPSNGWIAFTAALRPAAAPSVAAVRSAGLRLGLGLF